MYCSTCGVETLPGLSYCNRCGANLNPSALTTTQVVRTEGLTKPTLIIGAATVVITILGFMTVIMGATQLSHIGMGSDPTMMMVIFGMTIILISDIMLIRLLSRMITSTLQSGRVIQPKPPVANEHHLHERSPQQIPARPVDYVAPSVTENTTRTLEASYRK